jgi:hypothetical protein
MKEPENARWPIIRDVFIFQVKLAIDAIRDLLLSPVSIICGLADLIKGNSASQSYFHKLMNFGHQTDSWLNLFGNNSHDNSSISAHQKETTDTNVDQLFSQVESLLKDQHDKGGLTASAKSAIDRYLNKIIESKNPKDTPHTE